MRLFAFRLAVKLGRIDVDRMLSEISIHTLREWRAYADMEPFDEYRQDLRNAHIVQAVRNANRGKNSKVWTLDECTLPFGGKKEQSWQEQKAIGMKAAQESKKDVKSVVKAYRLQNPTRPKAKL